ncbi:MAG: DEAD/DEAH box helicase family protein, partial [Clostridia bacterium]|nr:DEAD/DEAH box helicase family protein [Clostridia bacterium]
MELYQHNKEAYDKIQTMFQREDRVAIIHATGTGKSFISLQWLYDNRDKKCLFLAPTYEILDQLERHMHSQNLSIKDFPNLECMIYDNLASLSKQALANLRVDNIVLDEFHR